MRGVWKKRSVLAAAAAALCLLPGCHGSRQSADFTIPEEFNTAENYEIN